MEIKAIKFLLKKRNHNRSAGNFVLYSVNSKSAGRSYTGYIRKCQRQKWNCFSFFSSQVTWMCMKLSFYVNYLVLKGVWKGVGAWETYSINRHRSRMLSNHYFLQSFLCAQYCPYQSGEAGKSLVYHARYEPFLFLLVHSELEGIMPYFAGVPQLARLLSN